MSQFITHNNKRYEVTNHIPYIGCLLVTDSGDIVEALSLAHIEILVNCDAKVLIEIPIATENTLSFTRIRLTAEDFQ